MAKVISLSVIFVVIVTGLVFGLTKTDFPSVQEIEIHGASPTTEARIRSQLIIKNGQPFWNLPVRQEIKNIQDDPWVRSVEIRREIPKKVVINIVERKPLALVGDGQGQFKYIDESNTVIDSPAVSTELAKYPTMFGLSDPRKSSLREQAVNLLKNLPPEGVISQKDVSDLSYDDEHGFQIILSKTGLVVELGKESLPVRVDRARKVVQYLDEHQINALLVDSDYAKKVLVKVRKGR